MRRSSLRLALAGVALAMCAGSSLFLACAESPSRALDASNAADAGDAAAEAAKIPGRFEGTDDAGGALSLCERTRAFEESCGRASELNCGPQFDGWCTENDKVINSEAFRKAELACLTSGNCDRVLERDCRYAYYEQTAPTTAQVALVAAYCVTCEPNDLSGCVARAKRYDATQGPARVSDIFVAAWELADPIVDEIRTTCAGHSGGGDAGTCAKAFAECAAGIYLSRLPNCP